MGHWASIQSKLDVVFQVAKSHGGPTAAKQVAYLWAKHLGGDSAVKLLNKFGLLDSAIDYATENWLVLFILYIFYQDYLTKPKFLDSIQDVLGL